MNKETNYAIIENGVCTNVIVATQEIAKEWDLVNIPNGYGKGDYYDGTNWTNHIVKVEDEEQYSLINAAESNIYLEKDNLILREAVEDIKDLLSNIVAEFRLDGVDFRSDLMKIDHVYQEEPIIREKSIIPAAKYIINNGTYTKKEAEELIEFFFSKGRINNNEYQSLNTLIGKRYE